MTLLGGCRSRKSVSVSRRRGRRAREHLQAPRDGEVAVPSGARRHARGVARRHLSFHYADHRRRLHKLPVAFVKGHGRTVLPDSSASPSPVAVCLSLFLSPFTLDPMLSSSRFSGSLSDREGGHVQVAQASAVRSRRSGSGGDIYHRHARLGEFATSYAWSPRSPPWAVLLVHGLHHRRSLPASSEFVNATKIAGSSSSRPSSPPASIEETSRLAAQIARRSFLREPRGALVFTTVEPRQRE